ncbi:Zn(II)2Cys6 transcription factor [Sclerotinia borealis F-4128]|uniref:Zn(II)2Cys6 transcription factor n=1 Tax=Sclerotinia borealis (strain F-4128) TaxID=1432307 RepID=W9CSK3_SCLBF|nr:Zn(II)2Cys6 transcription factor [Sclerotinia borealis F-4128]
MDQKAIPIGHLSPALVYNAYASTTPTPVSNTTFKLSPGTSPLQAEDGSDGSATQPPKKRQKRNKPTLSCVECVERKTKCDRGRPNCLACIKRPSDCEYHPVAIILESVANARRMTKPPKKSISVAGNIINRSRQAPDPNERSASRGSVSSSTGLLSNVPYSHPKASNVFGIGSEHPFANYWTCQGGLPEVISVLPAKDQSDILMERYFECVDPVYPMLHKQTFYAEYEHFWSLQGPERDRTDASLVAMIFSMMALGTQFVNNSPPKEQQQTAEFYVSAAHQSLRLGSYLNKASMHSLQAMVLITYFLINDNHASDGWAFAGILLRQAYAMGLHRDPNIVTPNASIFDKQQRRKLWQAVLLQDTFLTVLLSLPPSATHTDVNVEDLIDDSGSIAACDPNDTAYIRGCWALANLTQEAICSPRSLDLHICANPRQKHKLLADFRAVYRSLPDAFRSWDRESIALQAQTNKRLVRQILFLTSNYFHNVMLLQSSESPEVPSNIRGTLDAAHEAIKAFFLLYELLESESKVWWVFNHRAFLECMTMGNILQSVASEGDGADKLGRDPLLVRAKGDIVRMIQIMTEIGQGENGSQVARTRAENGKGEGYYFSLIIALNYESEETSEWRGTELGEGKMTVKLHNRIIVQRDRDTDMNGVYGVRIGSVIDTRVDR